VIWLVLAVLFVGWRLWRRANKRRLVAGLTSERPGFFIEPPGGRVGTRKDRML
jgi:hypothetical protein